MTDSTTQESRMRHHSNDFLLALIQVLQARLAAANDFFSFECVGCLETFVGEYGVQVREVDVGEELLETGCWTACVARLVRVFYES